MMRDTWVTPTQAKKKFTAANLFRWISRFVAQQV